MSAGADDRQRWATVADAAMRVGRGKATIYRWAEQKRILLVGGRVNIGQVLDADRDTKPGRPRKAA